MKRREYKTTSPVSWEICMQVNKQVRPGHGTTDWFQFGIGVQQGCLFVYCYHAYLTYMQSTSCEMSGWMKHNLETRLPGEI